MLLVIAMNYFNNGAQSMVFMVIVNMYQEAFFVSASVAQSLMAVIGLPMIFAFFMGVFSESIPLFGSRKKSYLILMSLI